MGIPDDFSPLWHHDKFSSLLGLGYSFFLEFFELFYQSARKGSLNHINSKKVKIDERIFYAQEIQHAKYHKILNEYLLPNRSITVDTHPRVYDFFSQTYSEKYIPILVSSDLDNTNLDHGIRSYAALEITALFESQTCAASIVFFETLFANDRLKYTIKNTKNLGVLYLLAYHFAEELEHCGVAIDLYEDVTGNKFWDEKRTGSVAHSLHPEAIVATLEVAKKLKINITEDEIYQSSFYLEVSDKMQKLLKIGFHPDNEDVSCIRKEYVSRWDLEWEPFIRSIIEESI